MSRSKVLSTAIVSALSAAALSLVPMAAHAAPSALRQIPASGITITRTWINQHQQIGETGVCAAFVNTSPVAAIRVEFLYSLISKDGKVLYSTLHEANGQFEPGALIQGENETTCDTAYDLFFDGTTAARVRNGYGSVVASVSQVQFADGSWWHAGPDIAGAAFPQPDAPVRIVKSFSWEPGGATQECATFRIIGSSAVRKMHFTFSHIADDGSDIVDDPYDVYPTASHGTACRGWSGSLTPRTGVAPGDAKPQILVLGKPARLVTRIAEVDFEDGKSWHAPNPAPSALAAAAVPATIDYTHAVWWTDKVDVDQAIVQEPASGVDIRKAYAWAFSASNECVDFANDSPKSIVHVRFLFSHNDDDGNRIGEAEPLDVRGSFAPGTTKVENCRSFDGNVVLPSAWVNGSTSGTILVRGRRATSSVRVEEVDFADGTSWRMIVPRT